MPINYLDLPIGPKYPYEVDCVVEIAKDTNVKYEYDEHYHVFRLDRCLLSSMSYPCSYGFIPSTLADDGDALDMLVYNSAALNTGTVVTCRVVGVLDMTDGGKKDYKVLGVPLYTPHPFRDINDIDPMFLKITRNFFQYYKELEGKNVEIGGWVDAKFAREKIVTAHQAYFQTQVQRPETCYQEPEVDSEMEGCSTSMLM
jgi:inorganic pyrophosphatase